MTPNRDNGRESTAGRAGAGDMWLAGRAARAHADVADQLAAFIEGMGAGPEPAEVAEYATLLSREQATLDDRTAALRAAGFAVPSLDADSG